MTGILATLILAAAMGCAAAVGNGTCLWMIRADRTKAAKR